jgi:hypothetical protein
MNHLTKNITFGCAVAFITIGAIHQQQPEKRVQLPPVTLKEYNVIITALQTCDCPSQTTPILFNSFVNAVKIQAPEWYGLKPDSAQKKGGKP